MIGLKFSDLPIREFNFKNTPRDSSATVDAITSIVTKESGKLIRTRPPEAAIVVKDGVAYAAWVIHMVTSRGPWLVVAFDQDHSVYSATCMLEAGDLNAILASRILR